MKDRLIWRAVAAALLLGAFAIGVISAAALPLPMPPPYGGSWHPWIASLALACVLAGAIFFRSRWARAQAWATTIALMLFECGFTVSRLPAVSEVSLCFAFRPWTRPLTLGVAGGLIFFLCALPDLLARRASDAESSS